ncbi:MAG: hybrid sensor histidine kinase/response regulator [Candidatus Hydrogenedentes bacterium]|nr:hybrid sensor histidine kinase/response regulator [Candidatus Hydrogenedentota bacterium]
MGKEIAELPFMTVGAGQGTQRSVYDAQDAARFERRGRRSRILVVDDENGPRQALRMLLKEDYDVLLSSGVHQALKLLTEEPVDVVITDIRMPHQTGMDLLRIIKKQNPDVQVIILTGYGQLDTAMEAIEHGAFAYLEKPFDNDVMLNKVRTCLERQRQEDDRRAMEYLAIEANRFETLGRLVSGTMHDLGTPLSVIGTHLELLLSEPRRTDIEKRLDTMKAQVQHCMDLVRTTMNFLRHAPQDREVFDFNGVVRLCVEVARPLLASDHVSVSLDLKPETGQFEGYLVLVRQAILNLIYNACQALERQHDSRGLRLETWIEEDQLMLAIEDNGPGVPVESRLRIFEPLFTTKGAEGTGLGLTVVRNVMHRHGGTVRLEDTGHRGARFVLAFPLKRPS